MLSHKKILFLLLSLTLIILLIPTSRAQLFTCCSGPKEGILFGVVCIPVSCSSSRCGAECIGYTKGLTEYDRTEDCSVRRGEHVYQGTRTCKVDTCTYTTCAEGQFCGNGKIEGTEECEPNVNPVEEKPCGCRGVPAGYSCDIEHPKCAGTIKRNCLSNCKWGEWSECSTKGKECYRDCFNSYSYWKNDFASLEVACPVQLSEEEYNRAASPGVNNCYYVLRRVCLVSYCTSSGECGSSMGPRYGNFEVIENKYYCKGCETENCKEKTRLGEGAYCDFRNGKYYMVIPEWFCKNGKDEYCPKGSCFYHGYNKEVECLAGCKDGKCIDEIFLGNFICPIEACEKSDGQWTCNINSCRKV